MQTLPKEDEYHCGRSWRYIMYDGWHIGIWVFCCVQIDKKVLAITWVCDKFSCYIISKHKPLEPLLRWIISPYRLCWAAILCRIQHVATYQDNSYIHLMLYLEPPTRIFQLQIKSPLENHNWAKLISRNGTKILKVMFPELELEL